jgi:hypothetical protein
MSTPTKTTVRVFLTLRASKSLYGYRCGEFVYDEAHSCFVYKARAFTVEEWNAEGPALLLRHARQHPSVLVEVTEAAFETPAVVDEAPVEAVKPAVKRVRKPAVADEAPVEAPTATE